MISAGFYVVGLRALEADAGQWNSADAAGHGASDNLMSYAGGDPINLTDINGLCSSPNYRDASRAIMDYAMDDHRSIAEVVANSQALTSPGVMDRTMDRLMRYGDLSLPSDYHHSYSSVPVTPLDSLSVQQPFNISDIFGGGANGAGSAGWGILGGIYNAGVNAVANLQENFGNPVGAVGTRGSLVNMEDSIFAQNYRNGSPLFQASSAVSEFGAPFLLGGFGRVGKLARAESWFGAADSGAMFSSQLGSTGPRATAELLDMMRAHGRTITTATEGSEALRFLDTFSAEASAGGEGRLSIILRENPSRVAAMEEFLHGTQTRLGIVERLGREGAEEHLADFMARHRKLLKLEP